MCLSRAGQDAVTVRNQRLNAQLHLGQLINQLRLSPHGSKLLVSSPIADYIGLLENRKVVCSRKTELRAEWRWFTHPKDSTKFGLLEKRALKIFFVGCIDKARSRR
jgi:hypothetical protein